MNGLLPRPVAPHVAAMSAKPSFAVSVVGLDASSVRLIEVVFRHIQHNRFVFRLVDPDEETGVDLLIFGAGDPLGVEALERARSMPAPIAAIAVVTDGQDPGARYVVEAGQLLRQLLPTLNRVVETDGLLLAPRRACAGSPSSCPALPQAQATAAQPATPDAMAKRAADRPRVLVVDDSAPVRQELAGAFERMGVVVESVSNGSDALARLADGCVDLALLGLELSDGDGLQLARAIRREPRWQSLPIVALGHRRSALDVVRSAAAGCSAFLAWPVDFGDLHRTVSRQLGRALSVESGPRDNGLAGAGSR